MSENHSNNERAEALRSLIQYRQPLDSALSVLSSLGWDSKGPVVYLQRDDVARILDRFLAQEMTADQVTDWADLIECREDIGILPGCEFLGDVIFRLANPNINGQITRDVVVELQQQLSMKVMANSNTESDDWRLSGASKEFLKHARLWRSRYAPATSANDHDHCEFCFAKFMVGGANESLDQGYTTADRYHLDL